MKKAITIICLVSLMISMCGIQLYQIYEKQMYKIARIKYVNSHPTEHLEGHITLKLSSLDELPMGYKWEDEGAEFTYKGMLYDIINIYKSESGFIINALADAPEISLDQKHVQLAHQQKESSNKSQQIFKWVFAPYIHWQKENLFLNCYQSSINFPNKSQDIVSIPLGKLLLPPEMN